MDDDNIEENNYDNVLNSLTGSGEGTTNLDPAPLSSEREFSNEMPNMEALGIASHPEMPDVTSSLESNLEVSHSMKDYSYMNANLIFTHSSLKDILPKIRSDTPQQVTTTKKSEIRIAPNLKYTHIPNMFFQRVKTFHNMISINANSQNQTAVEQPNVGPCSCFVCGCVLAEPSERFSYMKYQKLFSMQLTLLQLLSGILNQKIITNVDTVELCRNCSELINETDNAFKHLEDLKERIISLFSSNRRPKLTYQVLPKVSGLAPLGDFPEDSLQLPKKEVNLQDLTLTTPRRGRNSKKMFKGQPIGRQVAVKKKNGRPRKPYQCAVCRRKFLTQSLLDKHVLREHPQASKQPAIPPKDPQTVSGKQKDTCDQLESLKGEKPQIRSITPKYSENKDEKGPLDMMKIMHNTPPLLPKVKPSLPLQPKDSVNEHKIGSAGFVRPIQPKPETVMQTTTDGSLVFFMNPTASDASPALIKVSPGYFDLRTNDYSCYFCDKTFLDEKSYKMHKIAAHRIRKRKAAEDGAEKESIKHVFSCRLCNVQLSSKRLLMEHRKSIHNHLTKEPRKDRTYNCEHCSHSFNFKYELDSHRESHLPYNQVGPNEFACSICGLKVASKAALKIHFHRFHNKEEESKDFLCSKCGYMAATKKAFSDHLRIHSENPTPKMQCTICKKEMLPSSYKIHMLRIHGEARHACETCGQRFALRSDLMKHLNTIHSTLKPYDCSICNIKFVTSEALRYHRNKVHSTACHFCDLCGKCCRWKGELRSHINRCHSDKVKHQCSYCAISYTDKRKLRRHLITKHDVPKEGFCRGDKQRCLSTHESPKSIFKDKEKEDGNFESPQGSIPTQDILNQNPSSAEPPAESHMTQPVEAVQTHNLNNMQVYQEPHIPLSLTPMDGPLDHQTLQPLQQTSRELRHPHTSQADVVSQLLTSTEHHHHLHPQALESPSINAQSHPADHLDAHSNPLEGVPSIYLVSDMNMMAIQDEVS